MIKNYHDNVEFIFVLRMVGLRNCIFVKTFVRNNIDCGSNKSDSDRLVWSIDSMVNSIVCNTSWVRVRAKVSISKIPDKPPTKGSWVKVFWPKDKVYYKGIVKKWVGKILLILIMTVVRVKN